MRKVLSHDGLFALVRENFESIQDDRQITKVEISLADHLMSALGIFALKFPSLLKFETTVRQEPSSVEAHNFRSLFGLEKLPDDTNMRKTLDELDPDTIRPAFNECFHQLQRGKALESFVFYRGTYLLSIDGTGYFNSHTVHCENCNEKHHKDGSITYYHQMLGAALVHPEQKYVIPFAPEPILKQDGSTKNDCERNASARFLEKIKHEHPRLPITVVEDALASNIPHVKKLQKLGFDFLLGIKPGNQKHFFERIEEDELAGLNSHYETETDSGLKLQFRYRNDVELNEDVPEIKVNFLEVIETGKNGKSKKFSWITSFNVTKNNCEKLMKGGRARWKIENETFNTLKNHGYQFEHNFGHGNKNLSTVFAMLMMLAFSIDQVAFICNKSMELAKNKATTYAGLWEEMRALFRWVRFSSWTELIELIALRRELAPTPLDST